MAKKQKFTLQDEESLPEIFLSEGNESEDADMVRRNVLLKLKHIDVKFNVRGRVLNAIRDANLEIYKGETLAIVGESGSGKSVLTKTFAGMLDSNGFISHGNVYFNDDTLSDTTVLLTPSMLRVRDYFYNALCNYSFEMDASEYYIKRRDLINAEKKKKVMSQEDLETYEKRERNLQDDMVDLQNKYGLYNHHDAESMAKKKEIKEEMAGVRKAQKDLVSERKKAIRKIKADYRKDVASRREYNRQRKEYDTKIAEITEAARAKGLSPEILGRNRTIANEMVLSIGRYPWMLRFKYGNQIIGAYRYAMHHGINISTGKNNRRVFEPVVFRVEYLNSGEVETNKRKIFLEGDFLRSLKEEGYRKELVGNESLMDQAKGLHPHMRKSLIKKFAAAGVDKPEEIADLVLLKIAEFTNFFKAYQWANVLSEYAINYLKNGEEASKEKSKVVKALHGYAHIDCAKVRYLHDWEQIRGCRIATVFQDPMTSLDPIIPIGKQIMIVIQKHQHCTPFEAKRRALSIMDKVGIPDPEKRFDDYPFQYSGGMRQRIVIAIALSCQPRVLICDEPTTALDVTIQAQILQLIKKLSKDLGFTTVYITHDLGVVANVADRVAVLYGGQIIELGDVEDIFYDSRHPYTWALLSSMPQLATSGDELFSIAGTPPSLYNKIVGDAFAPRNQYALAIDFKKEPPMIKINDHHSAKTWLLDPRAPKVERPAIIQNLHEKMVKIYGEDGNIVTKDEEGE
ncbi:MAG: ATP-binding cassette domain-containing protein [Bacilli bacterium]|nr:ATP-binding cassette domain-containing protein [Bacilli bacterium]